MKIKRNQVKVRNGHNKKLLMYVSLKDIADMDSKEKPTNYNLNTHLKNPILMFISLMPSPTHTQNFKISLNKSLKTIKV